MTGINIRSLIWIAIGGAAGALLRHSINSVFAVFVTVSNFFTATYFVNFTGSFLMGYFVSMFVKKNTPDEIRQFMLIGLIGSYTTFSGFGIEAVNLLRDSPVLFSAYIFSQIMLGVIALVLGLKLGYKLDK